jgi:WhiB family transcriptional regulator, redox-sensing transcriptional regulator
MTNDITIKAACKDKGAEMFFVDEGPISNAKIRIAIGKAVSICNTCEVQVECLINSVKNNEEFGIWGGFTAKERKKKFNNSIDFETALEAVIWKRNL